jgi:hypothetical protein
VKLVVWFVSTRWLVFDCQVGIACSVTLLGWP